LYCRTSVPPFFSMITPFMVLGMDAIVRMCLKLFVGDSWEVRAAVRRVVDDSSDLEREVVRAANMRLYR
jgi:hypothetical protein